MKPKPCNEPEAIDRPMQARYNFTKTQSTEARMPRFYPDFVRNSPTRPPDWRWRRANALIQQNRRLLPRRDDVPTLVAACFLRVSRRNPRRAAAEFPAVQAAHELHEGPSSIRNELEGRFLARQSSIEIACAMNIRVPVADAFETTFFSCRDRLDARDWILLAAIGLAEPDLPPLVKLFAYFGGPFVLDAVLEAVRRRKQGNDVRENDPVLLAIDAMLLPTDEKTLWQLNRIMLELRSYPLHASEKVGADAGKLRQPGLSPSEIAGQMRAFAAVSALHATPVATNDSAEPSIQKLARAV
jgi:hypothetical protein